MAVFLPFKNEPEELLDAVGCSLGVVSERRVVVGGGVFDSGGGVRVVAGDLVSALAGESFTLGGEYLLLLFDVAGLLGVAGA